MNQKSLVPGFNQAGVESYNTYFDTFPQDTFPYPKRFWRNPLRHNR